MKSNVFKPAVFTPFSLVFEQHLRASRASNPLPSRTDAERPKLLRDCIVLAFHTLQPPDRVGVVVRALLVPTLRGCR